MFHVDLGLLLISDLLLSHQLSQLLLQIVEVEDPLDYLMNLRLQILDSSADPSKRLLLIPINL